jgi:DNA (cytosine-5)-methyltransferase 1
MQTLRGSQAAEVPIRDRVGSHLENTHLIEADARDLTARDLRPAGAPRSWRPALVAGGPPCQPWSSAGHQKGLLDPRGQLIAHYLRLIGELEPDYVLFENVRGLLTALGPDGRSGEVLESIQNDLGNIGYASRITTINAADYGAAQRRVRLMLIATRKYELTDFPEPTHSRDAGLQPGLKPWVSLGEFLAGYPELGREDVVRPSGVRAEELRRLTPGTGLRTGGRVENNRPSGHWGYRQDSFLADLSLPARTIRAASTPDWVRGGDDDMRRLTWRECAALQGFRSEWAFAGTIASRFRQIGNAVQVDVAHAVGAAILQSWRAGVAKVPPVTPPWPAVLRKRTAYTAMEHRVNGEHRVRVRATRPA